mgnify:CR=1 FL=1
MVSLYPGFFKVWSKHLAKCELCGKAVSFGHNVSHSKRRTGRVWMPNVQQHRVMVGGASRRMNVCTRCLRTQHKTAD